MPWTADQVLALAPDAAAARAGRELAAPRRWVSFASDADAIWGEHQGSAREPYQVAIDLSGPAFNCSCPSRKVPCKHALGLFLLGVSQPAGAFEPPEWAATWLAARRARKEPRPVEKAAPLDPERAARDQVERMRRREERITRGVEDLDRWLQDFARAGLAEMASRPWSTYEQVSARLVDAQAPGLARMVRDLGSLPHTQQRWPERMLINLGRLRLLLDAWRMLDTLDQNLRGEVRTLVGINEPRESVLSRPPVADTWAVVGRRLLEGERISVQRTWLWGNTSRRWALILEFSAGGQPLDRTLLPGTRFDAELCFYDGAVPLRALVKSEPRGSTSAVALPRESIAELTTRYAHWLGRSPWLERIPAVLGDVVPVHDSDSNWRLTDADRHALEVDGEHGWRLLALSGGAPIDIIGEWDGYRFTPLSVETDARLTPLRELVAA